MTPGVKDVALVPAAEVAESGLARIIEQLAMNPNVDVDKLERIIALQKDILKVNAKAAFDAAFAKMKPRLPQVDERGQVVVKGTLRSTYARLEDIDTAITPVLAEFGFAVRHRTEWPADRQGIIRIVGILSHAEGHSEESAFEAPMDRSEYRSDIQSMGSTVSYGRRYTTLDLLNIVTRGIDNDGATAGRPQPPKGYEDWWRALESVAENGTKALDEAWQQTKVADYKTYTVTHNKAAHNELKARAAKVRR